MINVSTKIEIFALKGLPEFVENDDLIDPIIASANECAGGVSEGDIIVVTQKIVSKVEGMVIQLASVTPSKQALTLSRTTGKDPRLVELILGESKNIIRLDSDRGIIITETHHGFICANAGIDSSNIPGEENVCLLPSEPNKSARHIRDAIIESAKVKHVAVIISDTFGRPWREGHLNFAIGTAGIKPLQDYRDTIDAVGKIMRVTMTATVDIVAAAADLVSGKATNTPVSVVRGLNYESSEQGMEDLLRAAEKDMFR